MVIFDSYVKLPEGKDVGQQLFGGSNYIYIYIGVICSTCLYVHVCLQP